MASANMAGRYSGSTGQRRIITCGSTHAGRATENGTGPNHSRSSTNGITPTNCSSRRATRQVNRRRAP